MSYKMWSSRCHGEGLRPTTDTQRLKLKLRGKIYFNNTQKLLVLYSLLYKTSGPLASVEFRILLLLLIL